MNKKIGIFMVFVLLVGAVFLSACQKEAVGGKIGITKNGDAQKLKDVWDNKQTPYEEFASNEINQYIDDNNVDMSKYIVVRKSTNGRLVNTDRIYALPIDVVGGGNGEPPRYYADDCDTTTSSDDWEVYEYHWFGGKWNFVEHTPIV